MNNFFDDLFILKLSRTTWLSLTTQDKIVEADKYFNDYINYLLKYKEANSDKISEVDSEINNSYELFRKQLIEKGNAYFCNENHNLAIFCYGLYFKYGGTDLDVFGKYASCLESLKEYALQIDIVKKLCQIYPNDIDFLRILAQAYYNNGDYQKAVEYYEKYLSEKDLISDDEYNFLGCYYNSLYSNLTHCIDDAIKSLRNFEKASDMNPESHLYAKNVTIMAGKVNDFASEKKHWDRILKINTLNNDDKYDYAAFCLKTGNFEEWAKYFDARFKKENNKTVFPSINKPKWNGTKNLSKSTLLVRYEQGFGDTLLMFGYMPRLIKLAKHVIFVVQNDLYSLLKNNDFGVEVLPETVDLTKLNFDYYIPAMSIPTTLKFNRDNISVGEGYIKADKGLSDMFREKYFNNDKLKIGVSLKGSNIGDKTRDIDVETMSVLDSLKNVEFYCLTQNIKDIDLECFKNNKIHNLGKFFRNFADTAAAMDNCDIVISTDNVLMNLAGALGKKTYGIFNWSNQFRWFDLTGDNTIWLTSVKPFVNDKQNNWEYSLNNIINEIKNIYK